MFSYRGVRICSRSAETTFTIALIKTRSKKRAIQRGIISEKGVGQATDRWRRNGSQAASRAASSSMS
jgi:hypothetical protein